MILRETEGEPNKRFAPLRERETERERVGESKKERVWKCEIAERIIGKVENALQCT